MATDDHLSLLFERAASLNVEDRERFLESNCGGDPELRARVQRLLSAHDSATLITAWDRPALENAAGALPAGDSDSEIGEAIGPYRIVAVIGAGGMGKVYRAQRADSQYDQDVAIKRIKRGMDAEQIILRFRAERQILAKLEHPNITRLLDGGATPDGLPYLVMEYVEGISPTKYCDEHGLGVRQRIELFRQICSAVHYAHQRMVIHRDLKPGNILVTPGGVPKLLDFGIAKVFTAAPTTANPNLETAMHLMTPGYASPEQIRGEVVTTATDVYSLGVILYELLSGHSPYRRLDRPLHELMTAVCEEPPEKPSERRHELRGDLDNIILKALRKDPAERYASADQFSEDLLRYLQGQPVLARGEAFSYVAAKFVGRNRFAVVASVLFLGLLMGALVVTVRARARAERRFNDVRQLAHSVVFDYHDAIEHLPGSTPVLERLVRDALKYLDGLSQESDDPELQRELVDAYVRIGHVQGDDTFSNLGDAAGAARSISKAVEIAGLMLRRDNSPAAQSSAAGAFKAQGTLMHAAGDLRGAEVKLKRAVELRESAAQADSANVDRQIELANAWRGLADLYSGGGGMQNLGRSKDGLDLYERAAQLTGDLSLKAPDDNSLLKAWRGALMELAAAEVNLGRTAGGDRDLEKATELSERIVAREPGNTAEQMELANACVRQGMRLTDRGEAGKAIVVLLRAVAILERLLSADPRNALYQRNLSVTENQTASALKASGALKEALPHNRRSLELAEALRKMDPTSGEFLSDAGISHRKYAESLLAAGEVRAALEHGLQAAAILCGNAKAAVDAYMVSHCGRANLVVGNARAQSGEWGAAMDSFQKASQIAGQLAAADPGNAISRSDWARAEHGLGNALLRVGRYQEARQHLAKAAENWDELRSRSALNQEDAVLAAETARLLTAATRGN